MAVVINGSGTVTGISVGGLPDGIVDSGTLATNSVDSAELIDGAVDNSHIDALAASKLTGALPALDGSSLTGISGGDNTPSFSAYKNSVQAITTSTWTKLEVTTEYWDTDSAFDSTTNYRFTVPSGEGGKYHLTAGTGWSRFDNSAAGRYQFLKFYKNGSEFRGGLRTYSTLDAAGGQYDDFEYTTAIDIDLAASDYVELYVWHNEGHDVNTSASQTFFTGFKLAGV
jgi:hypothetical protein